MTGGKELKLVIATDEGEVLGTCEVDDQHPWRGLLEYAAERWETAADAATGAALEVILENRW